MIIHGLAPSVWQTVALGHGYDVTEGMYAQAWKRGPCGEARLVGERYLDDLHAVRSWLDTGGDEPTAADLQRSVDQGVER